MLNIGSLILGICAWLMGVLAIKTKELNIFHRNSVLSFSLCLFSLMFQFVEISRRVFFGDYAAIEDTIRAVLILSIVLICITIVLNVFALVNAKNRR
jgi:uncharacterized membrane protein YozB (DUF420 family)